MTTDLIRALCTVGPGPSTITVDTIRDLTGTPPRSRAGCCATRSTAAGALRHRTAPTVCGSRRYARRHTMRTLMPLAGVTSTSTIKARLDRLRSIGLVTWDRARNGTLRPLVQQVEL